MDNNLQFEQYGVEILTHDNHTIHLKFTNPNNDRADIYTVILTRKYLIYHPKDEDNTFVFYCDSQDNLLVSFANQPNNFGFWNEKLIAGKKSVYNQDRAYSNLLDIIAENEDIIIPMELKLIEKARYLDKKLQLDYSLLALYSSFGNLIDCMLTVNKLITNIPEYDFTSFTPYKATEGYKNCIEFLSYIAKDTLQKILK